MSLPVVRGRLGCIKRRRAKLSKTIWANLGRESIAFFSNQAEQTQNQQALTSMVGACLEVGSKTSSPGKSWFGRSRGSRESMEPMRQGWSRGPTGSRGQGGQGGQGGSGQSNASRVSRGVKGVQRVKGGEGVNVVKGFI